MAGLTWTISANETLGVQQLYRIKPRAGNAGEIPFASSILVREIRGHAGHSGCVCLATSLASQCVDDLVYNERHNEVVFVKYLS